MLRLLPGLVCACSLLLASCTFDERGLPAGGGDSGVGTPDPDATTVSCQSSSDCASPPDACHLAGSCQPDGTCSYPAVDCSSADGACSVGQCDLPSGECVAVPTNEGMTCDSPIIGDWSECHADGVCASEGNRERLVAERVCTAGACTPSAPYEESETCTIEDVWGSSCGPATCGDWGECGPPQWGGDQCSTQGERSRECAGSTCSIIGSCDMSTWTETETCVRNSDGDQCWGCWGMGGGIPECECDGGMCVEAN